MQIGFIESGDGRLRDVCANERIFRGLTDARRFLEDRRNARPHAGGVRNPVQRGQDREQR